MIGFDRGQPPTPGRKASELTPRVNSKASELTFPCCESRGGSSPVASQVSSSPPAEKQVSTHRGQSKVPCSKSREKLPGINSRE